MLPLDGDRCGYRPVWLGTEDGKVADGGESVPWKIAKPQPPVQPLAAAAADLAIGPSLADDPDFYRTKHLAHRVSYLLRSTMWLDNLFYIIPKT